MLLLFIFADRNRIALKARSYLNEFARFKNDESTLIGVRGYECTCIQIALCNTDSCFRLLDSDEKLHPYERAQLGTLCVEDIDEARTLIPRYVSVNKYIYIYIYIYKFIKKTNVQKA